MKRKIQFILLTFFIICSVYLINTTSSKYISEVDLDGSISLAMPKILLETASNVSVTSMLPGDTSEFEFYVRNYDTSQVNEVQMPYYINVDTTNFNLPLTYKLYEISGTNETVINQSTEGFGPVTLNYGTQQEKQYKLEFIWDENDNSVSYADKTFTFQVAVNLGQVYNQTITSSAISINSQKYSNVSATIQAVENTDNTFDVTINNNNAYAVDCEIMEENDRYNVEYASTTDDYLTIAANTSQTVRVVFSGKEEVVYENIQTDSEGNMYEQITIVMDIITPYNVEPIQLVTNQIIYLQKSIKNNIIQAAGEITAYEEGTAFTGVSSSGEAALCSIADPVTGETIYFYRGAVTDNYVLFAGYTWRILRINSDGSLRVILDDIATTCQYQTSNTPTSNEIDKAIELLQWKNSIVYTTLQSWYSTNIATNYSDMVVESKYVFDTTYSDDIYSSETNGACYYFGAYLRVGTDGNQFKPTFSYTDETLITDYVGLITSDELLYAGAYFNTENTDYFLYNSSITTDCWTMSPSFWDNSQHYKAGMFALSSTGRLHDWPGGGNTLTSTLGLRPVISIRGDIEMLGTGTKTDPYRYE